MYEGATLFMVLFYITLSIIAGLALCEVFFPATVNEGFATLPKGSFWSTFIAPRSDIGPTEEDSRLIRDPRYFNGYADVSRLGVSYDFCRMVTKQGKEDLFFACALSGTENLDSTSFRTRSVSQGFRISQDDYMRDINNDGRSDYCRILLDRDSTYQPLCVRAGDYAFDGTEVVDPIPPEDIARLLRFYEGCELWLRFTHSLDDCLNAVSVQIAGGVTIDEIPTNPVDGVSFNGTNQYLRLFDGDSTTLGTGVPLRSLRTWMVWVKFTEFTNNAKIFDFGNGANADNVFLGILGKGDYGLTSVNESTVPIEPSGQQQVPETTPKNLMETTDANVNDFECKGIEVFPRKLTASVVGPNTTPSDRATLLYEVWDKKSRKMSITVNNVIPLHTWTHITITADSDDAFRPALKVYINGILVFTKSDGCLPSTGLMTSCYLGKSNWKTSSLYSNKDELFKGNLFDFRAYSVPVSSDFIDDSFTWGQGILGLQTVE